MAETTYAVTLESVQAAAARIHGVARETPVITCGAMDGTAGLQLFFKCEALQKTGSFKIRGATNAIRLLSDEQASHGVVTHSSGNHAQAVAMAAKARGIPAFIVMPKNAPAVKRTAVEGYGATVIECEPTQAARERTAAETQERTGAAFVHPSNDPSVISGQGTIALELLSQVASMAPRGDRPPVDALVVPVGGGGMISGIAVAAKALYPSIRVFGAEPARADDAFRSKREGSLQEHATPPTTVRGSLPTDVPDGAMLTSAQVADGLKTCLGSNTWPIVRDLVDDIILAEEDAIVAAMKLVYERMKIVIEPSAAVGVAAVLSGAVKREGVERVGVVLCGGNVDLDQLPWLTAAR